MKIPAVSAESATNLPEVHDAPANATLRSLFDMIDSNKSGRISRRELASLCFSVGVEIDLDTILDSADKNKNGKIEFEEFEAAMNVNVHAGNVHADEIDSYFVNLVGPICRGKSVPVAALEKALVATLLVDPLQVREVMKCYEGVWQWRDKQGSVNFHAAKLHEHGTALPSVLLRANSEIGQDPVFAKHSKDGKEAWFNFGDFSDLLRGDKLA